MAGNEPLISRAGANVPDKINVKEMSFRRGGRGSIVEISDAGPDIDLVPQPNEKNVGRQVCIPASTGIPSAVALAAGAGLSLSGEVYFIDADGNEYLLGSATGTDSMWTDSLFTSFLNFFCLQKGERIVYRPTTPDANNVGKAMTYWKDTDVLGQTRVPLTTSGVVVSEGVKGKLLVAPQAAKGAGVSPVIAAACGPNATGGGITTINLFIKTPDGIEYGLGTISVSDDSFLTALLTAPSELSLAEGEQLIARPESGAVDGPITLYVTWALLNAADEDNPGAGRGRGTAI